MIADIDSPKRGASVKHIGNRICPTSAETGQIKRLKATASLEQPIQLHAGLVSCKVGYVKRAKTTATIEHVVQPILSHIPRIEVRQIERLQT